MVMLYVIGIVGVIMLVGLTTLMGICRARASSW